MTRYDCIRVYIAKQTTNHSNVLEVQGVRKLLVCGENILYICVMVYFCHACLCLRHSGQLSIHHCFFVCFVCWGDCEFVCLSECYVMQQTNVCRGVWRGVCVVNTVDNHRLFVCLFVFLFVHLFVCTFVRMPVCAEIVSVADCLFTRLFVCVNDCLCSKHRGW